MRGLGRVAVALLAASGCNRQFLVPRWAMEQVSTLPAKELVTTAVPAEIIDEERPKVWLRADTIGETVEDRPGAPTVTVKGGANLRDLRTYVWLLATAASMLAVGLPVTSWADGRRPGCPGCADVEAIGLTGAALEIGGVLGAVIAGLALATWRVDHDGRLVRPGKASIRYLAPPTVNR